MAKRSPPMPFETGSINPSVAFAAIAASTALPPRFKISIPTCVAAGTLVQTIPCRAMTSERVAKFFPVIRSIWAEAKLRDAVNTKVARTNVRMPNLTILRSIITRSTMRRIHSGADLDRQAARNFAIKSAGFYGNRIDQNHELEKILHRLHRRVRISLPIWLPLVREAYAGRP